MDKIEHLGIAVKDLAKSNELFAKLLNRRPYKQESIEREGVNTSFFMVGETKIELLEANKEASPIANFIAKKGEGVHHIAFGVEDIMAEAKRLQKEGFALLSDEPKKGADGKVVMFLHPKSTNGVLVELCMDEEKL